MTNFQNDLSERHRKARRREKFIIYSSISLFVLVLVAILFAQPIYRQSTLNEQVIIPTSYSYDRDNRREIFSVDQEFRITDTLLLPYQMDSGTLGNKLEQMVTKNKSSLIRSGDYQMECYVKTWGIRLGLLSFYPHIYEITDCKEIVK